MFFAPVKSNGKQNAKNNEDGLVDPHHCHGKFEVFIKGRVIHGVDK
jgi:hypothetical protein